MKKISLFALALTTSLALCAQNTELRTQMSNKTTFGIRAGANLANWKVNDFPAAMEPKVNMKTSMHAGVFVNMPLGTSFRLQPGLEYSGQGSKYEVGTMKGEQDMHYLNVPIMFQFRSTGGFFAETGPQPGFLLSANETSGGVETDNKDDFDTFDLSWGVGLGFLSRVGLGVNARYNLGLVNTLEDGGGNNSPNNGPELKNQVIQIGLVYHFGAHK